MAEIQLTNSDLVALVDDDDFERVSERQWYFDHGYAKSTNHPQVYLHKFIMGDAPEGMFVDHIHGNKLDNRKSELRFVTPAQSSMNAGLRKDNKLGVKGVSKHGKKYETQIQYNGKKMHVGMYPTPEEASTAYQAKALELFGEYARVN
jgi:hypothetical protein